MRSRLAAPRRGGAQKTPVASDLARAPQQVCSGPFWIDADPSSTKKGSTGKRRARFERKHPMTIMRKTLHPILACLALSLPVAAQGNDTIVVGASLPLTGNEARTGQQYQDGYDLAFEMARMKGGLLVGGKRRDVELRASDDGSDPARAAAIFEQLIAHDKVKFLL